MQQSPSASSLSTNGYYYPASPMPTQSFYDSAYASYSYASPTSNSFHFSSCPYSNDSYYPTSMNYPAYYSPVAYTTPSTISITPCMTSTPVPTSNVVQPPTLKTKATKRRQQEGLTSSPSLCPARKRISDEAIDRLNAFYSIKKRPTEAEKDRLAMECNISLAQVNTWFNNARSRRGDTNPKLTQKLLKQQIDTLNSQVAILQQQQNVSLSSEHYLY